MREAGLTGYTLYDGVLYGVMKKQGKVMRQRIISDWQVLGVTGE